MQQPRSDAQSIMQLGAAQALLAVKWLPSASDVLCGKTLWTDDVRLARCYWQAAGRRSEEDKCVGYRLFGRDVSGGVKVWTDCVWVEEGSGKGPA